MSDCNQNVVVSTPYDMEIISFNDSLTRRQSNRTALLDWIRKSLVEGTDFGRIHMVSKMKCAQGKLCINPNHFSKSVLFKPGAEKICGLLGVSAKFPSLRDYETAALGGAEIKTIVLRCELQNAAGWPLADGIGARNLQQDGGDLNKSLKMAEKSAQIDATLRLAGISEIFTQDLDDAPPDKPEEPVVLVTNSQLQKLRARLQGYELPLERVLKWVKAKWGVEKVESLTFDQFLELDAKLDRFAEQVKGERDQTPVSSHDLRKVLSFMAQNRLDMTAVIRKAGLNKIEELTYRSLERLWKVLESAAERQAIQQEGELAAPVPPGSEAACLLERAKQLKAAAVYADGQYYRDIEESLNLEKAARQLLAEESAAHSAAAATVVELKEAA